MSISKHLLVSLAGIFLLLASACSTTRNLPEGEILYIGTGRKTILNPDQTKRGQAALSAVEKVLDVAPNNSVFGSSRRRFPFPIGLWVHNAFVNDSTFWGQKLFSMFASKPVLLNSVNPPVRTALARNVLREHGYFRAEVRDSVVLLPDDSLQARVFYSIDMGQPFTYDSIVYLPDIVFSDSTEYKHRERSFLKKGDQFNIENVLRDRSDIVSTLRNRGYYFYKADLLRYRADTLLQQGKVYMQIKEREGVDKRYLRPWTIGKVSMRISDFGGGAPNDSIVVDDLHIAYPNALPLRKGQLRSRIYFREGDYYSQLTEAKIRENLVRLGAFSFVDFRFSPMDSLSNVLNLQINATLDKPWDVSLSASLKSKSNNFLGPGIQVQLARRNVLGGGERLAVGLFGSYEWFIGKSATTGRARDIHSYELGTDINLSAPSLLIPGLFNRQFSYTVSSNFSLSGSTLNRARFFRMNSIGLGATYELSSGVHRHQIAPLRMQYNYLSYRTDQFDEILNKNPILRLSLDNLFVPQMSYTYTFDNVFNHLGSHRLWFELYLAQAGNILNGIYFLAGTPFGQTKKIVGVPFAQFIKGTGEVRYTYTISNSQTFAARLGIGGIYSYGNSSVAPYNEQFYVGGANSVRAFVVRSIGPGKYIPRVGQYSFMDQSGDLKLEFNLEYRLRLIGQLHGALFLDTGNIWLINPDANRPGGSLQEVTDFRDFLNQLALGTGLGLRYDLDFIVIRFDAGIGLHVPHLTSRRGYYNIPNFMDGLGLHLAIGYPF